MAVAPPARLVALRALGLGDLLTAVPALRALARAFPSHSRALAAPAPLAPLARLVGWTVVPAAELRPLPRPLHGADAVANLHGRGPQSHRLVLAAGARRRLWFEHPDVPESAGSPPWRAGEHEVERWCRLLREEGIPASADELDLAPPPGEPPRHARAATVVHPGAASPARRWPLDRYAAVARAEAAAGRRVLITGSARERPLALALADRAGLEPRSAIAGATDLAGLARVVTAADRVVCGDTGVGHLATALGTPSVLLFGPTSPAEWGPPRGRERHRVLWAGRTGDPHARGPDSGLLEISVGDVLGALERLPDGRVRHDGRLSRAAAAPTGPGRGRAARHG